ncbi:MAG: hypothetical protein F6K26_19685 [Moorea sp. SIO2I5]|nr:hypothetical protein [Moorena sp. SIO2I5]
MNFVETWLKGIGAKAVKPASELYIRHAGNITGVVNPLYGSQMLLGGTPNWSALGTFGYHFDVRGGIEGLGNRASENGFKSVSFSKPIFNIGIQHAQIKAVPNLALVSPGSGFQRFASSAGRIVEFNAGVGQALGIAAITALLSGRNLTIAIYNLMRYTKFFPSCLLPLAYCLLPILCSLFPVPCSLKPKNLYLT